MNRLFSLIFALLLSLPVFAQQNEEYDGDPFAKDGMSSAEMLAKGYQRYQVEKGIIHYELTGTEKGTLTIFFDRWGLREAQYKNSEMRVLGMKQKTNSVTFLDGENQYNYDPKENTYFRIKNTMIKPVAKEMGNKDLTVGGKELLEGMGGEQDGYENVLDKNCEVWVLEGMNMRNLIWKGVSLKIESKMLGVKVNQTATKAEFGVAVPEDKVLMPRDAESQLKQYGY